VLSDELISEIRERVDIVALIGEYVRLQKRGANHVGLCPFHAEKTPSFNVSAANKFFHCFGCKESGDAFGFVMRMEGVPFPQAARTLAERAGVVIPEHDRAEDAAERRERQRKERLQAVMEEACRFYEQQLRAHPGAEVAQAELSQRNVLDDTAKRFRLGYAPHAWDALATHLSRKSHAPADAEAVGLLARRRDDSGYYDRFRGRLMFPVRELSGQVVAFSGRLLPPPGTPLALPGRASEVSPGEGADSDGSSSERAGGASRPRSGPGDENAPKYYNSAESPLYHKGDVLFGLHEARVEVRRTGWAILCEGNFDLLALHQAGHGNAVAPLGTAFTAAQAKLLGRFAQRVTLLFDGDAAGLKAVRAAAPLLQQHALRGAVAALPTGQDPDSFLRSEHGPEALQRLLASAQGVLEFLIDSAAEHAGPSASERAAALASLGPLLQGVESAAELELYMERAAQRFGLSGPAVVRRELRRGVSVARPRPAANPESAPAQSALAPRPQSAKLPKLQAELVGVLLDRPTLFSTPHAAELRRMLTSAELQQVFDAGAGAVQENGSLDLSAVLSALGESAVLAWVKERLALQLYRERDDAEELLHNGLSRLAKQNVELELPRLGRQIHQARLAGDDALAVRLTKERDELFRSAHGLLRRER